MSFLSQNPQVSLDEAMFLGLALHRSQLAELRAVGYAGKSTPDVLAILRVVTEWQVSQLKVGQAIINQGIVQGLGKRVEALKSKLVDGVSADEAQIALKEIAIIQERLFSLDKMASKSTI